MAAKCAQWGEKQGVERQNAPQCKGDRHGESPDVKTHPKSLRQPFLNALGQDVVRMINKSNRPGIVGMCLAHSFGDSASVWRSLYADMNVIIDTRGN